MEYGKRPRLLIADDDTDLQNVLKQLAELEGYEVLQAFDGHQALNLTLGAEPDVVLIDICMPYVDGRDVLAQLKANQNTAAIPVLMCSARHEQSDRQVALRLGAEDYIDKPFEFRQLIQLLGVILQRAQHSEHGPH